MTNGPSARPPAFLDDSPGIRAVLDAIDQLADDPRPDGSFPYGSPDLRRLRVGRYRVLYGLGHVPGDNDGSDGQGRDAIRDYLANLSHH